MVNCYVENAFIMFAFKSGSNIIDVICWELLCLIYIGVSEIFIGFQKMQTMAEPTGRC